MSKWHYIYIVVCMLLGGAFGWFTIKLWPQPQPKPFMFDTSYPTLTRYSDYPTLNVGTPDGKPALVELLIDGRLIGRKLQDGTWEGVTEDQAEKDWIKHS